MDTVSDWYKYTGVFRHFKLKMKIIWAVLTNEYCNSDSHSCWWLSTDETILITFDKKTYHSRSCGFDQHCTCEWKKNVRQ